MGKNTMMKRLLLICPLLILSQAAMSQSASYKTPGGQDAQGVVQMCTNSSGQAVPVSSGTCANNGGTPGGGPSNPSYSTVGKAGTSGDTTIVTGGTAQTLFGGTTPPNGYAVSSPNLNDDCWVSDTATAAVNGLGSHRVPANGGEYRTPTVYKPVGPVSVICPSNGDKVTAEYE